MECAHSSTDAVLGTGDAGDTKTVDLVAIGGNRVIRGGNNLADGAVSDEGRDAALGQISDRGFSSQEG